VSNLASIYFEDDRKAIEVEVNQSLTDICDEHPTAILFGCRNAVCATCLVEVTRGLENLSPITLEEQDLLSVLAPDNPMARLACQCIVKGDISLKVLQS
jgi:ferredoxin